MNNTKNIVCIGGGTGLSNLISGLKKYYKFIYAIVSMTDDGLSTGRIRRDFNILPPGDIRKCLISLSGEEILKKLFDYRFARSKGLAGHSLGNLIILSLQKITGNFSSAIKEASKILNIKGQVIPSTLDNIYLAGVLKNKKTIFGERKLFNAGMKSPIQKVWLSHKAKANPEAIKTIQKADTIIIGPGSFYTSIIPNLLIKDIVTTIINNKKAIKIFICNVSTERGETQNFTVYDHIAMLKKYSNSDIVRYCLVNSKLIKTSKKRYKLGEINNITTNKKNILGCKIIKKDLIDTKNALFHDSKKLAKTIKNLIQ